MYDSSKLHCIMPSFNDQVPGLWAYMGTDAAADADADGFITDAKERGLKVYDIVYVYKTDATPKTMTTHIVTEINADGSANLSNAGATHGTDSD